MAQRSPCSRRRGLWAPLAVAGVALSTLLPASVHATSAEGPRPTLPSAGAAHDDAALALGRQLFYQGSDYQGTPLKGQLSTGQALQGEVAACVRCHRRSGEGSQEGSILIPPVTAPTLFRDGVYAVHPGAAQASELARLVPRYQARHAYADDTLLRAIEHGLDADGQPLADPMPRFALSPAQRDGLLAFLHQLGSTGIQAGPPAFWLVLTADAEPRRSASVRTVVEHYVSSLPAGERWLLRVFDLREDPAALRRALDDGSPRPLALLSGAAGADWRGIAEVCESARLPCLFPSLLAPPQPHDGEPPQVYAQYLSAGLPLEALAAASAVRKQSASDCSHAQIVVEDAVAGSADLGAAPLARPGVEASAYAAGLAALRAALPQAPLVAASHASTSAACQILWTGEASSLRLLNAAPPAPGQLRILVQSLLPLDGFEPPAAWKAALEMVSGFDPQMPLRLRTQLLPWLGRQGLEAGQLDLRSAADAYAACYLTQLALSGIAQQRLAGTRIGPFDGEELIEALQDVSYQRRAPGVVLYSPLHLGEAQHTAARTAVVLGWDSATAHHPRLLLQLPAL